MPNQIKADGSDLRAIAESIAGGITGAVDKYREGVSNAAKDQAEAVKVTAKWASSTVMFLGLCATVLLFFYGCNTQPKPPVTTTVGGGSSDTAKAGEEVEPSALVAARKAVQDAQASVNSAETLVKKLPTDADVLPKAKEDLVKAESKLSKAKKELAAVEEAWKPKAPTKSN